MQGATIDRARMAVAEATRTASGGAADRRGPGIVFYQAVGNKLMHWHVDVEAATLTARGSIELPSKVQYAWPHPSRKYLYVSTSDAASGNAPDPGRVHRLLALRIGPDGAAVLHGEPQVLPQRPIHNSVDRAGRYALTCYNTPSNVTVHRIADDGTLAGEVRQEARIDVGIYAHQIVPMPGNRAVLLVTRGNRPRADKPEDPGALKIYRFEDGQLSPLANLPVGGRGGLGYGPRHVDFHPSKPWMYVSVESQNQLHMHRIEGDVPLPEPDYNKPTTIGRYEISFPQAAGAIHLHPDGRTVYLSNRANSRVEFNGKQVFRGGENNIAVFALDPASGEPKLLQNADPQSFHIRTFSIDPSGRLLVAGSIVDMWVREGDGARYVPAGLTLFRIGEDGKLAFVRKYDVDLGGAFQWWTGFLSLPDA